MPIGIWVLLALSPEQRDRFLGGNLIATTLIGLAVMFAFAAMHLLLGFALGNRPTRSGLLLTSSTLLLVLLLMASAQRVVHTKRIQSAAHAASCSSVEITHSLADCGLSHSYPSR